MTRKPIRFIDLVAQQERIKDRIDAAIQRTLAHGAYILGPEVGEFESALAKFCGAKHAIGCSNGTDALSLALMAREVGPGHAVFCPSFTFAATAEVVALIGATPYFVDIHEDTFNLDPKSLERAIAEAKRAGLTPAGVISVDLFGQPADYTEIEPVVSEAGLWMICDAAQAFGADYRGRRVGTIGAMTTTSFFPAKPLGAYGDGGAIFTDDDETAAVLRSLLVHGQGADKYDNVRIGMNGRLDTLQAGILIEKLAIFADEIEARNRIAANYNDGLRDVAIVPTVLEGCVSTWAQYTIRTPGKDRGAILARLKDKGVPTAVYYPTPLHRQTAYRQFPAVGNGLPVSDRVAQDVFSLPMHPYLAADDQAYIIESVREAIAA
ncbi:DegT/DnrJ/EryC1/StrS aminotransferase family protein [Pseudaminobacter sp. 19-2017]|uniref:DegT/DnrJ/EryC1/StrS aminotransferase family protein n=1 Tax=Pseudaminobacter soli (ex Zhang et al. 2022) TaxID=2831468 RepID=A0A942I2W2_9HYPH|nr:DegT/DnrJ/EryC1/StrS aminotransferase family protein [Pseudaminobacter soli]MBS3648994.1 DegT/DnrJ/EryC1/StrS aminotransferase family protein [Pseudaminobacter soli]